MRAVIFFFFPEVQFPVVARFTRDSPFGQRSFVGNRDIIEEKKYMYFNIFKYSQDQNFAPYAIKKMNYYPQFYLIGLTS